MTLKETLHSAVGTPCSPFPSPKTMSLYFSLPDLSILDNY